MRHIPPQKNATLVTNIIFSLLIFAAVTYAIPIACEAAGHPTPMPWIFTLLTLTAIVTAVTFFVRYPMTGFVYLIQPRNTTPADPTLEPAYAMDVTKLPLDTLDLIVMKSQGSRMPVTECVLPLSDLIAVCPVKRKPDNNHATIKSVRDHYRARHATDFIFYNYTRSFLWDEAIELVFLDGQRIVGIILEADEPMRQYLMQLKRPFTQQEE